MIKPNHLIKLSILSLAIISFSTLAAKPKVFSYWAGWSNAAIPDTSFDGVMLAFAQMRGGNNAYYTDYSGSGNYQLPSQTGPYATWNSWVVKHWNTGGRGYVSYGGGTNDDFRGYIIKGSSQQLSAIAGEIKANVQKYYFDGVELDIEGWWNYGNADNAKFASNLASMIKTLRQSLDNDPATAGKPIVIAVGWNAAGNVQDMPNTGNNYAGTMNVLFNDADAMNAIYTINIMSYNTGISNFYARLDLIDNILNTFVNAGVPKEKLMFGIQPCENGGNPPATSTDTISALGQHIAANQFGGLFMWGIGTSGMCGKDPGYYLAAMKAGLGV